MVDSNVAAADADDRHFEHENPGGWAYVYRVHDLMVGAYGAVMAGKSREVLRAAHRLDGGVTPELLQMSRPPPADPVESHRTALPHVLIRFGRWRDILDLELPEGQELFCSTAAVIHYARGAAFSALGRISEAGPARTEFTAAVARVPDGRLDSVSAERADALKVAAAMLEGELDYRKGDFDESFAALCRANRAGGRTGERQRQACRMPAVRGASS
ncbi:hypothetical protein ACFU6I_11420 [Streptomyces sp. NPDC057486]|uniref:hypothetical protein n=1 Tax=Streptomyces sp. NPDC057486 TaxID=3346145 RepID=UPI0036A2D22F